MKNVVVFVLAILLIACDLDGQKENISSQELKQLIQLHEDHKGYDEKEYPLGLFTKDYFESEAKYAEDLLKKFESIKIEDLSETEQISVTLLQFILKDKITYYKYERYLNPLLSDSGFHCDLVYEVKPLVNYSQVKAYLNKLTAIPDFVDQQLVNLREGLDKGVSQPLVIFKGYESTYNEHIVTDYKSSYFYGPFKNLPNELTDAQKDSVLIEAKKVIELAVVPQFKRIKDFFEKEYFPNTRSSLGLLETPNGALKYQDRINFYTTSNQYTADAIHKLGLKEVDRIRVLMQSVIKEVGFIGEFSDFLEFLRRDDQFYAKTPNELLMRARDIAKRVDAQLPRYFKTLPRKPYGVAKVPDAIAPKYTTGRYVGAERNSTEPGYYWVNTYNLKSRSLYTLPALTVHEAVPGHHLQGSLNAELGDSIPQFRKDLYLSAYGEGWGLYSEYLAREMGMYTTPYERFGQLTYEMWRACRLVVDTGIHAKGWTRKQAADYMASNTALSLHEVNTETDRYISWPGQALSYKIGELKIRELRNKAEQELGSAFDLRVFHEVVLEQGTVTLAILESRVDNYIDRVGVAKK